MPNRLDGKVALVTGTSPNIGAGIAEGFASEGAKVACIDVSADNARQCAEHIVARGGRAIGVVCDVTDEAQVRSAVMEASETFRQPVEVLVNNAVVFNQKGVLDMSLAEWTVQTGVILTGAFLFTKYVARALIDGNRTGSIVNIVSTAGHQGQPGNVGYCTGKCGLLNFTRSVAMELAGHGIRVNSLTPTATDPTEGFDRSETWGRTVRARDRIAAVMERFRKGVPMQRLPSPKDYAKAAVFLASDDADMITGIDLRVDGGAIARYWAWNPDAG